MSGIDTNTLLMLHMNGTDGSTTFVDSSASGRTITPIGNAQIDTAQSKFGGASGLFDGSGDGLSVPDSADWSFGSGDLTLDFWIRFNSVGASQILYSQNDGSNAVYFQWYQPTGILSFQAYASAALTINATAPWSPVVNTWYHVALVRNGGVFKYYVNGAGLTTTTSPNGAIPNVASILSIGSRPDGTGSLNGWLDEVRVSKVARWTTNFTPDTVEYTAPTPPPPPAVGTSEQSFWSDKAAIMDPDAYIYRCGSFNVTEAEPVYLVNGWQMNYNSTANFWYHRKGDIENALMLPAGTPIKHNGSPSGYGFEYGYAYYAKPSLVNSDTRYEDARDLYYQRIERLKTLPLYSCEVTIAQTHTVGQAVTANTLVASLPTDFDNGLIVHMSMMDGCWMVLEDPSKTPAVDQVILNLWDELDDVKNMRNSGKIMLPFKRTVFPQLRIGFGSAFISASGTPLNPITPVVAGSATYPQYGQIKYYKLPSDW